MAVLYILDASVLITASSLYYPIDGVPEFWGWLRHVSERGEVKVPLEIYEEIRAGRDNDPLLGWITDQECRAALVLDEAVNGQLVRQVIEDGYANDLTDDEVDQLGRDPFLIAYALVSPATRCVVTTEVSKPKKTRQNRHVPDVCATLGVNCCDTFTFLRSLNFSTGWNI